MVRWWSPKLWGAHLLAVALIAVTVAAGFWQLGVWHDHRADQESRLAHGTAVPISSLMRSDQAFPAKAVGRPVRVSGSWVVDATVYVEKAGGYWVVTPLATDATTAVPVVRGWTRTRPTRTSPAPPPAGPGTVEVTGWLQPADGPGSTPVSGDVLPQLDIPDLIPRLRQNLYGAYVIGERPEAGLERVTAAQLPQADSTTGLRNLLYAIEWWLFGCLVAFAWVKHVQERTAVPPDADAAQDAPIASVP